MARRRHGVSGSGTDGQPLPAGNLAKGDPTAMSGGAESDRGGGGGEYVRSETAVRLHAGAVRQELAGVLEDDHSVAEKTPTLLRVAGDHPSRFVVGGIGVGTGGLVLTHGLGSPVMAVTKVTLTKLARYS
jgi:hypothetical protein